MPKIRNEFPSEPTQPQRKWLRSSPNCKRFSTALIESIILEVFRQNHKSFSLFEPSHIVRLHRIEQGHYINLKQVEDTSRIVITLNRVKEAFSSGRFGTQT
jgi:hypothetical protein